MWLSNLQIEFFFFFFMVTDNFFVHQVSRLGRHADDDRIGNKSLHKGIPVVREVRSCLCVGSRCCGPQSHPLSKGLLQRVSSFAFIE